MNSVVVKILALAVLLSLLFSSSESRSLRHFSRNTFQQRLTRPHNFARRPLQGRFFARQGRGRNNLRQGRQEDDLPDTEPAETESPLPKSYGSDDDVVEAPQLSYGAPLGDTIDSYQGDLPGIGGLPGANGLPGSGVGGAGGAGGADGSEGPEGSNSGDNADGSGDNARSSDIPPWCNPTDPMGAWLNYEKVRDWCIKQGFQDLSPYGGSGAETEETTTGAVDQDY